MRRELYIGGRLADIDGVSIPLTFACSEIADLSGVSGNYSLTVKLPLTGNNIMIAYFANLPNTSPAALWSGYKTTASYFVDGVPVFQDAVVRLLSTEKSIDIQITFGNLAWLDVLGKYKLKDYINFNTVLDWNYWSIENETTDIRWIAADYGGTFEGGLHMERLYPCVSFLRIWNKIWSKLVVDGHIKGVPNVFVEGDIWMPFMSMYHNPALPIGETFDLDADLLIANQTDPIRNTDGMSNMDCSDNHPGMCFVNTNGYFIAPVNGTYRIRMSSSVYIVVTTTGYSEVTVDFSLKKREDDSVVQQLFSDTWIDGTDNESHPFDFDGYVTLKKGDVIYLDLFCDQSGVPGYQVSTYLSNAPDLFQIDYISEPNKKTRLEFFMPFDADYNLPDMLCKDFIKAGLQLYGRLVESKESVGRIENKPVIFSLDSLTGTTYEDWSDKLISFDRPKIEWNLGFSNRNYLRYTEDETDGVFEDAYFTTYETDNSEKDLFKSVFAASDDVSLIGTSYFPVPVCSIPQWVVDEKTDEWKFEGKCKQRIFRYYQTGTTFESEVVQLYDEEYDPIVIDESMIYASYFSEIPSGVTDTGQGLNMDSIVAKHYSGFIEAVKSNRLFTFQFLLNQIDINKFTHITPVWIEKFSNFFFVKKILNWESGRVCNVEMLQLRDSGALGVVPEPPVITSVKYGLLYNWYAATDVRNIAADGWEVPTKAMYQTLSTYLGGDAISGLALKEVGTQSWIGNLGATNSSKFYARGSGRRINTTGLFEEINLTSSIWAVNSNNYLLISAGDGVVNHYSLPSKWGMAIRLIKTTTTLTDGQTGTYTGNDGKVYRTICIGTQEWLADNLCETKYRNGDTIPEVTDNAAWAALETGALCAYNNDWDNVLITE